MRDQQHSRTPRTFAIGDLHGCFLALQTLIDRAPILDDDLVITLGDYVDRGLETSSVLDWVISRVRAGRCIPLRGNHEIMMLEAIDDGCGLRDWLGFGGQETLNSYKADGTRGQLSDVSPAHLEFLRTELLPCYETDRHLFVHATLQADKPMSEQPAEALYWNRFPSQLPHFSGKAIVCGHTSQRWTKRPNDRGFAVCIDTWACGHGWLTCLDVDSGTYYQASQSERFRSGQLKRWQGMAST